MPWPLRGGGLPTDAAVQLPCHCAARAIGSFPYIAAGPDEGEGPLAARTPTQGAAISTREVKMRFGFGLGRVALAVLLSMFAAHAAAQDTIRIGVLKFGTVNWEIDTILHN